MRVGCAIVVLSLVGCGKRTPRAGPDDAATAPPVAAPPRVTSFDPPLPAAVDEPALPIVDRVELLEAGRGARAALRYAPAAAYTGAITAQLRSRELVRSVETHQLELPPIRYGLTISGVADGAAPHTRRLQVVGLPGEIETVAGAAADVAAGVLASYRARVERKRAWIEIDDRGIPVDAGTPDTTTDDAHDSLREIKQLYFSTVVPFPEGAVAVGGRWRTTIRLKRAGVIVKQIATYELLARSRESVRVKLELRQIGEPQVISPRGLPPGAVAELIAFVYEARGELEVALARPFAIGTVAIDQRVHGRILFEQKPTETYTALSGTLVMTTK